MEIVKKGEFGGHLLAVYGTLREGHGNNYLLRTSELLSTEKIKGFGMVSLGGFPALYETKDESKEVTVEVWRTPNEDVNYSLDSLERCPGWYHRKLIETSQGKAWVYYQNSYNDNSSNQVDYGDWNQFVKERRELVSY